MHPPILILLAIWPSLPHCPIPIWLLATNFLPHHPCHLVFQSHHPQQLPSSPPAPCHPLSPLPFGTPGPNSLSHLAPCLSPPAPTTPTPLNIITKGPLHTKGNLSFSEFPSFLMFVSISPCVSSISPHMKIISFTSHGRIPNKVTQQTPFH